MKVIPTLYLPLLGLSHAQDLESPRSLRRELGQQHSYDCNATTDAATEWEKTLGTCNLQSQHLSFMACTKINTGQRHNQYQSSAHSYAYYVKQFFSFKTCYHGNDWKKLYFWEQSGDEVCKMQTEHTMSIKDYFYATKNCVDGYCNACYNQCEKGRRLDEDENDDINDAYNNAGNNNGYDWSQISMNCNVCKTGCVSYATLASNYGGNDNNYVESPYCTRVFDQSGTDYYYGPQCSDNGGVSMGFFFDNQCELSVKKEIIIDESATSALSSSFDVFSFVHGICHDCATGICESVYDAAYHCSNDNGTYVAEGSYIVAEYEGGYANNNNNKEMESGEELCSKTHKLKDIVYYHNHSSRIKQEKRALETVGFVVLGLLIAGFAAFGFISYTYYVRHCVDWGDSSLMCWTDGCGGCGGRDDDDDDEDDVVSTKKKKGRRLV